LSHDDNILAFELAGVPVVEVLVVVAGEGVGLVLGFLELGMGLAVGVRPGVALIGEGVGGAVILNS